MTFSIDSNAAMGLFVGLIAADISLFQFAHLRHHELSLECFRIRDSIEALREKICELTTQSNQANIGRIARLNGQKIALQKVYPIILNRYYWATWGIKSVPTGFLFTLIVGVFMLFTATEKWSLCGWILAVLLPVVPVLVGTAAILFGDLWVAERAQAIMNDWFMGDDGLDSGDPPDVKHQTVPIEKSPNKAVNPSGGSGVV